jgi:hypothetical protein
MALYLQSDLLPPNGSNGAPETSAVEVRRESGESSVPAKSGCKQLSRNGRTTRVYLGVTVTRAFVLPFPIDSGASHEALSSDRRSGLILYMSITYRYRFACHTSYIVGSR